ncbi:hypothetical protein ACVB8X_31935 [Streptomyces sp. NRAIS4]
MTRTWSKTMAAQPKVVDIGAGIVEQCSLFATDGSASRAPGLEELPQADPGRG